MAVKCLCSLDVTDAETLHDDEQDVFGDQSTAHDKTIDPSLVAALNQRNLDRADYATRSSWYR